MGSALLLTLTLFAASTGEPETHLIKAFYDHSECFRAIEKVELQFGPQIAQLKLAGGVEAADYELRCERVKSTLVKR